MTITKSLKTQLEELDEFRTCHEIPEWPDTFIGNMAGKLEQAKGDTRHFSAKQVEKIEELYVKFIVNTAKHF